MLARTNFYKPFVAFLPNPQNSKCNHNLRITLTLMSLLPNIKQHENLDPSRQTEAINEYSSSTNDKH